LIILLPTTRISYEIVQNRDRTRSQNVCEAAY
jgi:hypothetical protein